MLAMLYNYAVPSRRHTTGGANSFLRQSAYCDRVAAAIGVHMDNWGAGANKHSKSRGASETLKAGRAVVEMEQTG